MNLWQLKVKDRAKIRRINGNISESHLIRLKHLGIDTDVDAECVRVSPFSGPKSFQIGDGIFSLDQEIACHVEVTLTHIPD